MRENLQRLLTEVRTGLSAVVETLEATHFAQPAPVRPFQQYQTAGAR
jgi:hypothetical protein